MKYFFLGIDIFVLCLTYILMFIVVYHKSIGGFETAQFLMIAILFADRMQNEIKKDLEL